MQTGISQGHPLARYVIRRPLGIADGPVLVLVEFAEGGSLAAEIGRFDTEDLARVYCSEVYAGRGEVIEWREVNPFVIASEPAVEILG
jgi:hypothetical protein